jgi:ribosomal protein L21E
MSARLRVRARVTVANPRPHHREFAGMRGTVTCVSGASVLVSLDEADEEPFWASELKE